MYLTALHFHLSSRPLPKTKNAIREIIFFTASTRKYELPLSYGGMTHRVNAQQTARGNSKLHLPYTLSRRNLLLKSAIWFERLSSPGPLFSHFESTTRGSGRRPFVGPRRFTISGNSALGPRFAFRSHNGWIRHNHTVGLLGRLNRATDAVDLPR